MDEVVNIKQQVNPPNIEVPSDEPLRKNRIFRLALIIFSIVFFTTVAFFIYKLNIAKREEYIKTPQIKVVLTKVQIPSITAAQLPSPTETQDGLEVFNSEKLGIQFNYSKEINGTKIVAHESGNKVFISSDNSDIYNGQSVEVFEKPANRAIEDTIKEKFLVGKDPLKCFVQPIYNPDEVDSTVGKLSISFPRITNEEPENIFIKTEYCSLDYAETNGVRYFQYDTQHPTKYLFFNIGQYSIGSNGDKSWQDTIEITD